MKLKHFSGLNLGLTISERLLLQFTFCESCFNPKSLCPSVSLCFDKECLLVATGFVSHVLSFLFC